MISRRRLLPVVLNVYFLLAKKLKQKAAVVEIIFALIVGSPKAFRAKRTPKSMAVFATPTVTNLTFFELLFTITGVIFLYEIKRSVFRFVKNPSDVLTYDS